MKKRAILSRKRSSKEELLFNMENVPSVSKSAIDNEKISYNEHAQKCHPKGKKCHPWKSIIYNKKISYNVHKKQCRKVLSTAEKVPSQQVVLLIMEEVLSVSGGYESLSYSITLSQ